MNWRTHDLRGVVVSDSGYRITWFVDPDSGQKYCTAHTPGGTSIYSGPDMEYCKQRCEQHAEARVK